MPNLRLIEVYAWAPVLYLDPLKPVFKSWGVDVVETFSVRAFDYYEVKKKVTVPKGPTKLATTLGLRPAQSLAIR